MLEAIGVFLFSIIAVIICLPLWPFAIPLFLEWRRMSTAPDLETA